MKICIATDSKEVWTLLAAVTKALQRQLTEHFSPTWGGKTAKLIDHPKILTGENTQSELIAIATTLDKVKRDAVIIVTDQPPTVQGAVGYHDIFTNLGIAYGVIYTKVADQIGEPWSITLSHELLELVLDPEANVYAMGPHPDPHHAYDVFHWFEACDAVQSENYAIDGIRVSNFVLPLYFTRSEEPGAYNDYLSYTSKKSTLRSFGVAAGGYVGFYDPKTGIDTTFSRPGDALAYERIMNKRRTGRMTGRMHTVAHK